jgi:hypothetical protein
MEQTTTPLYEPLASPTHIRLIDIQGGGGDLALNLTLEVQDLDLQPDFDALSYCWGDPAQRRLPAVCNGVRVLLPEPSCGTAALSPRSSAASHLGRRSVNQSE